jgi:hypothetical protein
MHPAILHDLAKIKIAEELEYAERMRRYRAAETRGPRSIDFTRLAARIRLPFLDRGTGRPEPAGA